jgi:hypothetical protein
MLVQVLLLLLLLLLRCGRRRRILLLKGPTLRHWRVFCVVCSGVVVLICHCQSVIVLCLSLEAQPRPLDQ